jgi:hypothetical protein
MIKKGLQKAMVGQVEAGSREGLFPGTFKTYPNPRYCGRLLAEIQDTEAV